ncbi:hypothetical protein Cs7R123_46900 [Catellatospora sp. TT07R-123]|uniref:RHS repeat domain-containing protein n=1 Tax=Catellatospora sp. TT07R-123 TaxID=2733863 RepID=UPI001B11245E|nr:FG-GAP-like repeat-containing protein [Catellatospora sp. TT07R-123]GHJ47348.1 hypothetical protein Cs7R123_46900 [Catellatospora sp. TT07R-123]
MDRSVPVRPGTVKLPASGTLAEAFKPSAVTWPQAGKSVIRMALAADGRSRAKGSAAPGGLPVTVTAVENIPDVLSGLAVRNLRSAADQPASVQVEVLTRQQAAAVGATLLMRVSRTDGTTGGAVRLGLDYSSFAHAYGADWAWRLRLSQVPPCALTTPQAAACGVATPLRSVNDGTAGQVSAEIVLDRPAQAPTVGARTVEGQSAGANGVLVALLTSGASSDTGNFTKSDLKQSSSWSAGGSAGDFTYSYPIQVPPVPGDLTPQVALNYSSAAVDGQTAGGNTQPSVIGEGWSYSPGFIERTYRPCAEDGDSTDGGYSPLFPELNHNDLCWRRNNATIMLNGKSSDIVWGDDGTWRLKDGDGEKVELLHGVLDSNQDKDDNEYWKVTTRDGTQYFFGQHTMRTGATTGSVQWVPVFANHTGEPCQNTTGVASSSRCSQQAMRWMLDYVLDRNNNEMTLFYSSTDNRTALNGSANTTQNYRRDIRPVRIEYGTNKVLDAATVKARAQVVFTYSDRCLTASCSTHDEANWPDTPWDLECTAAPCSNNMVPSFWSTKRLSKIETQVLSGGVYATVDEWALEHSFPSTGTSLSPVLWLNKITHTGKVGGTATLPSLQFPAITSGGGRSQNRADYDPGASMASHMKYRIVQIKTESGKQIDVTYSGDDANNYGDGADCVFGGTLTFPNPDVNTHRCFPQWYTNPSGTSSGWSWWHKRVVIKVVESDLVGGSPPVTTAYAYSTASSNTKVLWAHDDGAAVFGSPSGRSWGSWRGYTDVTVTTGPAAGTRSQTSYLYFRGLHGDSTDTGTRSVTITDGMGLVWYDLENRAGHQLQEATYDQAGGTAVEMVRTEPWEITTGTRTLTDWATPPVNHTYITRDQDTIRWEWTGTGWSTRDVVRQTFSTTAATAGRLVDSQQEYAPGTGQDTCTRYTYADAPTANMYSFVSRTQTVSKLCSVTPTIPADLLSDTRNYYDTGAWGAAPSRGNVTQSDASDGTGWVITSQGVTYDQNGQVTSTKDALGRQTQSTYSQNADGRITSVSVTNAAGHVVATTLDAYRGLAVQVRDANNKITTATYDPMGRLISVTKPGNASGLPDTSYAYVLSNTAGQPSTVQTKVLGPNGNQITSYELYDGFMHVVQTQGPSPATTAAKPNQRVIADTKYDDRGQVVSTSTFNDDTALPGTVRQTFSDDQVDRQTRYTYDGRGRKLTDETWSRNVLQWKTSTAYSWDRNTITPPRGGTPTQNIVDDRGSVIEKRQFHSFSDYQDLVAGDFNKDGKTDIVAIRPGEGFRATYTGKGDGTFTFSQPTGTGWNQYRDWTAGEFSGDTAPDLIGVRKSDGALWRYTNDGTGGFPTNSKLADGWSGHGELAAGDFTGDGKADLVAVRSADGMLQLWTGNGAGTLSGPTDVTGGWAGYKNLVAADVDGNGKTDLLAVRTADGMLRQWLGNGNGTFATGTDLLTGWSNRVNLAAGDFTGDGKPDLFGADDGDFALQRWTRNATTFTSLGTLPLTAGQGYDTTKYDYSLRNELLGVTDPANNHWAYQYDMLGRPTTTVDPDSGTTVKQYDNAGQLLTSQDGRGQVLAYVYDNLGRKIEVRDTSSTGALRAAWTWDTVALGQPTSSTRYDNGLAYVSAVTSYDDGYRPTQTTITIPASAQNGALAGTYTSSTQYTDSGATKKVTLPTINGGQPVGGLPLETVTTTYTDQGLPATIKGVDDYLARIDYHWDGATDQTLHGTFGKQLRQTNSYQEATGRLGAQQIDTQNQSNPANFDDKFTTEYNFDATGNLTWIAGKTNGIRDEAECFDYDGLRRLTQAWTEASISCATPQRAGADPYWRQWGFDIVGNRLSQVDKGPAADTAWTYHYATSGQTHTLTQVDASGPLAGASARAFDYDAAGNTRHRQTETGVTQDLTWDREGHLATLAEGTNTIAYVYDAEGARLITRAADSTKLYLGSTELELKTSGAPLGTRFYANAVRNATGLKWTVQDHHGTQQVQIDASQLLVVRNRTMPYGEDRGAQGLFTGDRGYVGGIKDPTGLVHLGAREYDPGLGRFASVDPLLDLNDPGQWNPYLYSRANPTTFSDPSGLIDCGDIGCHQYRNTGAPARTAKGKPVKEDAPCAPKCPINGPAWCPGSCQLTPEEVRFGNQTAVNAWRYGTLTTQTYCDHGQGFCQFGTDYEKGWCLKVGPFACQIAGDGRDFAEKNAKASKDKWKARDGLKWQYDDEVWNAKHHGLWMAYMVANGVSPEDALDLAYAHEFSSNDNGTSTYGSRDMRIDMVNNKIGIAIGQRIRAISSTRGKWDTPGATNEEIISGVFAMIHLDGSRCDGCFSLDPRY